MIDDGAVEAQRVGVRLGAGEHGRGRRGGIGRLRVDAVSLDNQYLCRTSSGLVLNGSFDFFRLPSKLSSAGYYLE